MNNNEKRKKNKKETFDKISVYLPPGMLEKIDNYKNKKGYGNRSALIRRALDHLFLSYPLDTSSSHSQEQSLYKKLQEIQDQLQLLQTEKAIKSSEEKVLAQRTEYIDNQLKKYPLEEIPNAKEIEEAIMELIDQFGELKDFVIMQHLGKKYDRGFIWSVLLKLKDTQVLEFTKGVWRKYRA